MILQVISQEAKIGVLRLEFLRAILLCDLRICHECTKTSRTFTVCTNCRAFARMRASLPACCTSLGGILRRRVVVAFNERAVMWRRVNFSTYDMCSRIVRLRSRFGFSAPLGSQNVGVGFRNQESGLRKSS
jgi:hypothetical protein